MPSFQSLLAKLPVDMYKSAQMEVQDRGQMEKDFANLAYSFLKDRATGMMPYLIGFETVESTPDGASSVGIFGFKIGSDFYYIPVFFVNNQVKGMDMIFSRGTNSFMPLSEEYVDEIVNRNAVTLGEPVPENVNVLDKIERPNFNFLTNPSTFSWTKQSAAQFTIDAKSVWNELQSKTVDMLKKDASFQEAWGCAMSKLMKCELPIEKKAEGALVDYLKVSNDINRLKTFMGSFKNVKFANAVLGFYPDIKAFDVPLKPMPKQAAKITIQEQTSKWDSKNNKSVKEMIERSFVIEDTRTDSEKSEVFDTEYVKKFISMNETGKYKVLSDTGLAFPAMIFNLVNDSKFLIIPDKMDTAIKAEAGAAFVTDDAMATSREVFDAAKPLSSIEVGSTYVIVTPSGDAIGPVEIRSVTAQDGKRTSFGVHEKYLSTVERSTYGDDFDRKPINSHRSVCDSICKHWNIDSIQIAPKVSKITQSKDTAIIPETSRVIKMKDGDKSEVTCCSPCNDVFKPGRLEHLTDALIKSGVHKLTVGSDDGLDYYTRVDDDFVDGRPSNYKSAMIKLVCKYGLPVEAAEIMLKEAKENFKSKRLVKIAQSSIPVMSGQQLGGVSMPSEDPTSMSYDGFTGLPVDNYNTRTVYGQNTGITPPQRTTQIPGFTAMGAESGSGLGQGAPQIDQAAMDSALQASQAGQKQVFDHSTVGGLSRLYDVSSVIDSYVPEMLKSLDRVGRILFLFYWKNEEFVERYGDNDLSEMEDTIRGVFQSFGKLINMLKQKSMGSSSPEM